MLQNLLIPLALAAVSGMAPASTHSFNVRIEGAGKPVILIPGLVCTGDVWSGTVDQLKSKYKCYVLTLPGFGDQAPIKGDYLPRLRDEIIAYVKENHLDHPAVVGHSLGGFMTLYMGIKEPDLFGPLISVDGVPFLPAVFNPTATAQSSAAMAEQMARGMANLTQDQFKQQVKAALDSEITDPKQVAELLPVCARSDHGDFVQAVKEMMMIDLRDQMGKIKEPLMVIGVGGWQPTNIDGLRKNYQAQLSNRPQTEFVMDEKSRHFVMYDDPSFFYKTIEDFLGKH